MAADGLITLDIKTSGDTRTLDVIKKQITALTNVEKIYNKNRILVNSSLKETNKLFANELNLLASLKVEMGVDAVLAEQAFAGQTEATRLMIENLAIEISTVLIPTLNAFLVWIASNMPVINLLAGYTLLGIKNTLDGIGLSIGGLVIPQFEALLKWAQDNAKPLTDAFEQAFSGAQNSINNISGVFNTLNSKMRTTLSLISQVKTQLSSLGVKSASTKSNEFSGVSGSAGLGSTVSSNNSINALGSILSNSANLLIPGASMISNAVSSAYGLLKNNASDLISNSSKKITDVINSITNGLAATSGSFDISALPGAGNGFLPVDINRELKSNLIKSSGDNNDDHYVVNYLSNLLTANTQKDVAAAFLSNEVTMGTGVNIFSLMSGLVGNIFNAAGYNEAGDTAEFIGAVAGGPVSFVLYTLAHSKSDEETKKILEDIDLSNFIPDRKFATGTPYIPNDMIALVHEGEMIVPKSQNPYAGANRIKSALNVSNADRAAASNNVSNVTYTFNSPKALGMSDVLREMRLAEQRKVLLGV